MSEQELQNQRDTFDVFTRSRQQLIRDYIHSFKTFDNTLSKANEGIQFYQKVSVTSGEK